MIRILLQFVLPLVLPGLLFALWSWLTRGRPQDNSPATDPPRSKPWFLLILGGLLLMLAGLAATAVTGGMKPGGKYQAPYSENGKIVPGTVIYKP